jgi:hypothetical protein
VRRGDQSPFGSAGREPATLEASDAAQELGVGEDRFDDLLAAAIERAAGISFKYRFDAPGLVALGRVPRVGVRAVRTESR